MPTTLRVVLIENLRRLAERVATNKSAREIANLVCDRIDDYDAARLDALRALLRQRGGRADLRAADLAAPAGSPRHRRLRPFRLGAAALPDLAAVQVQQPAEQAADNLSVSNSIGSLRSIGNADWQEIISTTSTTLQRLLDVPSFTAERDDTRDQTLHAVESLARRSGRSETSVRDAASRADAGTDPGRRHRREFGRGLLAPRRRSCHLVATARPSRQRLAALAGVQGTRRPARLSRLARDRNGGAGRVDAGALLGGRGRRGPAAFADSLDRARGRRC